MLASGGPGDADQVDVHTQTLADHAPGIANAPRAVDAVADGQGVDHDAVGCLDPPPALLQDAPQIGIADLMPIDGDLHGDGTRFGLVPGHVDPRAAQGLAGHFFGGVDHLDDRLFGRLHVGDRAGPNAA